jgi:arylsulfatase A-like enzyme
MPGENILVIAVDGLRAASLGAYGNTSFSTSALDQFAAESFLLDNCYADAVELPQIYRALWQSCHPLRGDSRVAGPALPRLLADRGFAATLLTDEPALAQISGAEAFGELVQLTDAAPARAGDVFQTGTARLFTAACDELQSSESKRLIWLHARGLYGPWDAPLELQEPLLAHEEGDPPPCEDLLPPDNMLDDSHDPDTAFRWSCAYAAQVMVLDACIHAIRETLAEASDNGWLVVFLGLRGFPLGEHGRIGGIDGRLYVEQLHVPMLWRFPDGTGRLARSGQLASHLDLLPTLLDWVDGSVGLGSPSFDGASLLPQIQLADALARQELIAIGSGDTRAIRTAEWTFRCDEITGGDELPGELFVRPDDLWEANDVAALCPEVVDNLASRLRDATASFTAAAESP